MARGKRIIVSSEPRGRFMEGTIRTAEKPGTVVQIDVSKGLNSNGRPQWEVYNPDADGDQRLIAILLPDENQGKTASDAYAAGDQCFVYVPLQGEELNMLVKNLAGTGDDHSFGDILMVDDGTGKLIATTGSPESEAFQLLEDITNPTSDTLAHTIYTGY